MTKLLTLDQTLNEFSYGQALLFYKEDIDAQKKENKVKIYFEQDCVQQIHANPILI